MLFALTLIASPVLAGGGGAAQVDKYEEPYELLDGQCWSCEIDLYVFGCAGPAITQNLSFEAEATSAQGCADELYDQVDAYMTSHETCIQEIWNVDFEPFVLTQGAVNHGLDGMTFDSDQDVLECDSSAWVVYLESEGDKFRTP